MKGLLADSRHAFRLYRRTPAASLLAVVALAVGMAFVGAFLSLYVDLILRPHAGFEPGGRLVTISQSDGRLLGGVPWGLVDRVSEEVASVQAIAGVASRSQEIGPEREQARIEMVTREFFEGIRPRLALGRGFAPAEHEPDGEPAAVVSHRYWRENLNEDPNVLGTTLEIATRGTVAIMPGGRPEEPEEVVTRFRIVGVMAPEMRGIMMDEIALWVPFERVVPLYYGAAQLEAVRRGLTMLSFGRLSPGARADGLARELNARYLDARQEYNIQPGMRLDAIDGVVRNLNVQRETKRQLELFLAGSVLLALVAACNVSLFLLARAPGRRRELGIRMAVGAPLKRLGRQLATESALLVVIAAVLGLALSIWLGEFLRGLAFLRQAEWSNVTLLDWRVLGLVGALLLLLALAVSLAPILGLKRLGIAASSRQVAAGATIAQRIAGSAQVAIAGTLAGAAIAFAWYLGVLIFGHPGYETRNLHAAQLSSASSIARMIELQARLENVVVENSRRREAIESLPGVTAVTFGSPIPGGGGRSWSTMPHPRDPTEQIRVYRGMADSRLVDVLGYRLMHGRAPADGDVAAALVNQTLARELFGRDDVVGESLPLANPGGQSTEIIGVLEDLSFEHPNDDVLPYAFLTSNTTFFFSMVAVIESSLTAGELQQALQGLVDSGELELAVASVRPLRELRANLIAADRGRGLLTILTAALVVFLAALGFYGTQRYLVTAGRREYAIRASLGAGPRALGRLVLSRGLVLSLPGLVTGTLGAFMAVAWLRGDFVAREISPVLVTLAVVAGLTLLLVAASLGPARQARRTQPAPLLRED